MSVKIQNNYAIYLLLFGTGIILLVIENHSFSWVWLFLLIGFSFLTLLNDFILNEQHWWNTIITIFQCTIVPTLIYVTYGYGSLPFILIVEYGMCSRYRKNVSIGSTQALLILSVLSLYSSPERSMRSFYPAIFIFLLGLSFLLMLLSIQDAKQSQRENMERIIELQLNRKELRDLNQQMKHYSEEMEKVTILRERNRMSKQIHDSVGHVLTAVSVQLEAAELLIGKSPDESLEKIANAKEQARKGLRSIKEALFLIDEDNIQFKDRIFDIIKSSEKSMGIRILPQINVDGDFPVAVQELLLAALKEGITNGVRHGQATAFVFRLVLENEILLFYLEDNGIGCEKISMGYGLTAMEKQVLSLGGRLEVHSVKDEGFSLKTVIPCRRDNQ